MYQSNHLHPNEMKTEIQTFITDQERVPKPNKIDQSSISRMKKNSHISGYFNLIPEK